MRSAVVLALLAVGVTGASGAKLDKTACTELSSELAGATAAGVKGDMERGPEWAKSNLLPERLASIQRLIEVQEQLEFRCGTRPNGGGKGAPAKPDAPGGKDETPGVKVEAPPGKAVEPPTPPKLDGKGNGDVSPHAPERRLQATPVPLKPATAPSAAAAVGAPPTAAPSPAPPANPPAATAAPANPPAGNAATASARQGAPVVAANPAVAGPPVTKLAPIAGAPAPSSLGGPPVTKLAPIVPAAAALPPAVSPLATQPATPVIAANPPVAGPPVTKLAPLVPAAAGHATPPTAAIQPLVKPGAPALKKPADPAAQALGAAGIGKKPSRRDSTSAYVTPDEVSPYSLYGRGSER